MDVTWLRRDRWSLVRDVLATAVLTTVFLVSASKWGGAQVAPSRPVDTMGYAILLALATVPLFRRRFPEAALAVACLLVAAFVAAGYPHGPYFAVPAIAGFTLGQARRRWIAGHAAASAATLIAAGEVVSFVTRRDGGGWGLTVGLAAAVLAGALPIFVGALVGEHRAWRDTAEDEARQRLVDAERLRMAREVHDVVGHSLSIISLQAGVALHVLDRRPEQAQDSLEAIRRTAVEALDELRATLALTRSGGQPFGPPTCDGPLARRVAREPDQRLATASKTARPEVGPRAPLTGLGRMPALLAEVRRCGVPVEADTRGPLDRLPADVDLAAYRIVQESLTNVLRHAAPGARVSVTVAVDALGTSIEVRDHPAPEPGPPPASGAAGQGLTGLRERAEELGGWLTAGRHPDGGWRVSAWLPTTAAATATATAVPVGDGVAS
jgi:signal transduction histidine kinase